MKMSILQYFNKKNDDATSSSSVTEPISPADEEVIAISQNASVLLKRTRLAKNHSYTEAERFKIGKYALEHTNSKAISKFSAELGHAIPESTVRNFKSQYKRELKGETLSLREKVLKKMQQGRKSLLGAKLDNLLWEYVNKLRDAGGVVNTSLVLAAAEGLVKRHKPSLLAANGGPVVLKKSWALSQLKRMGFSKRKATKAARKLPRNCHVFKSGFLNKSSIGKEEEPHNVLLAGVTIGMRKCTFSRGHDRYIAY
jgi:hypothetical protein